VTGNAFSKCKAVALYIEGLMFSLVKSMLLFITKPKAESGNYQRERPMLHMLKLKSPENAR